MARTLNISQVDTMFASGSYPIEFLLFFDRAFDVGRLKEEVRRLRHSFWPAFGSYRHGFISSQAPEDEEWFLEESRDEEFPTGEPDEEGLEESEAYRSLPIDAGDRLFVLKAVRFRNGLALVPRLSHLAGDGYSYFYLLSIVAGLVRLKRPLDRLVRARISRLLYRPHHRRTALRAFEFADPGDDTPKEGAGAAQSELETTNLRIPRADVRSRLRELSSERDVRLSTNDYLSAVALKRMVTTHRVRFGDEVDLTTPIDVRRKVKEFGARFFGNAIMLHTLRLDTSRIEETDPGAIALDIRRGFPAVSTETFLDYLVGLENRLNEGERPRPYDEERGCLVTNLSRLPSDRLDFGSGPPRLVMNLSVERHATIILASGEDFLLRMTS